MCGCDGACLYVPTCATHVAASLLACFVCLSAHSRHPLAALAPLPLPPCVFDFTHLYRLHHERHDVWVGLELGLQGGQVVVRDDVKARHEGT